MAQTSNEWLSTLSSCPIFQRLSTEQLMRVAELGTELAFPAGMAVTDPDKTQAHIYVVIEGLVSFPSLSKQATVAVVSAGEVFGHAALIPPYRVVFEGTASSDCRVLALPCSRLSDLLERDSELGRRVWQGLATEFATRFREAVDDWRGHTPDTYLQH